MLGKSRAERQAVASAPSSAGAGAGGERSRLNWAAIISVPVGMLMALSTWFLTNAVAPGLEASTGIAQETILQLTNGVQGGFIAGTVLLATTGVADRVPSHLVFAASACGAGLVNASLLLGGVQLWSFAIVRVLTGVFLAGVYPIGMKLLFAAAPASRGLALGVAVGALTLGSGLPHLLAASFSQSWEVVVAVSSSLCVAAGLIVGAVAGPLCAPAPAGGPGATAGSRPAPLDREALELTKLPPPVMDDAEAGAAGAVAGSAGAAGAAGEATPRSGASPQAVDWTSVGLRGGRRASDGGSSEDEGGETTPREDRCGGAWALWSHVPSRLAFIGYLGHVAELYAAWTSFAPFLRERFTSGLTGAEADRAAVAASLVTFAAFAAGAVACPLAGWVADRWLGRTATTSALMVVSGATAVWVGFTTSPTAAAVGVVLWGATIVPDSAQFSTAIGELAPPERRGAMLSVSTGLGFLLTMVTIATTAAIQQAVGWGVALSVLAIGPAIGVVSMLLLRAQPEAAQMAGGRR